MSLTSDIATLVSRVDALINTYEGKETVIDAAVAAAIAAVPLLSLVLYVDQINGNDANPGTAVAPVASLTRAIALAGAGRSAEIKLLGDYAMERRVYLPFGSNIRVVGEGAVRKLTLGLHDTIVDAVSYKEIGGFWSATFGVTSLNLANLEIVFPLPSGTMVEARFNSVLKMAAIGHSTFSSLNLGSCILTMPVGGTGYLLGSQYSPGGLAVNNTTWTTANMAGKWIAGVASGTQATALATVLTNLVTL